MLSALSAENFRNYALLALDLSDGTIVVFGDNAQGKTNLLEAIHLLGTGRLLRGRRDVEAIHEGATSARVEGRLFGSGTRITVELRAGVRKRALVNGASLPRAVDLMGRMPTVSFSNLDLEIVRGEPSVRRLFLDVELSQLRPLYFRRLSVYKRALEQRNALLKLAREARQQDAQYESWEHELAESGAPLREMRREFLAVLGARATSLHAAVGSGEALRLEYVAVDPCATAEELRSALVQRRERDVAAGLTTIGPHRDDFLIWLEDRNARLYGSQGQQRTACISLKLGVLHLACEALATRPVLLLDDVFSELDPQRRASLVRVAEELAGQTILTCTEREQVGARLGASALWLRVRAGEATAE